MLRAISLYPITSLLLTAAQAAHKLPAATNNALARFSVAHLSSNALVVSAFAMPTSTDLSSKLVAASDCSFAKSFLLVGAMKTSVKGMMLGKRIVAAMLSLKGKEFGSSGWH